MPLLLPLGEEEGEALCLIWQIFSLLAGKLGVDWAFFTCSPFLFGIFTVFLLLLSSLTSIMMIEVEAYHPPPLWPAVLAAVVVAVGPPFPWVGVLAAAVVAASAAPAVVPSFCHCCRCICCFSCFFDVLAAPLLETSCWGGRVVTFAPPLTTSLHSPEVLGALLLPP